MIDTIKNVLVHAGASWVLWLLFSLSVASVAIMLDPAAAEPVTAVELPAAGEIVLVVGPEGGISPAEADALQQVGAVPARLGPTVLRASTAGVVAAGILLSQTARWASAPG